MVAAAHINLSFEDSDGTSGEILGVSTEPFALFDGGSLSIKTNGGSAQNIVFEVGSRSVIESTILGPYAFAGGETLFVEIDGAPAVTATFNQATAAQLTSVNSTPFTLTHGGTLRISIDHGPVQTIVFDNSQFTAIGAATIAEVVAAIIPQLLGATPTNAAGALRITTTARGAHTRVEVVGGTNAAAFAFPGGSSGTGTIQTIGTATATEIAADLVIQLPGGAFAQAVSGVIRIGSTTKGAGSLIDVSGGTAAAAFGFPAGAAGVDYFVSIGAATAAEVAARITDQLSGGVASDASGAILLASTLVGASACVEAIGGTAFSAFGFPPGEVCGVTNPGYAQGWTIASTSSLFDFAEFSTGLIFPGAFETFTLGWPASPGAENDVFSLDENVFLSALFDTNQLYESFLWVADTTSLPALTAANFNTVPPLVPSAVETFGQGWPVVPGSEADVFTQGTIVLAQFDTTPEAVEDFAEEWQGNEGDGTTLVGLTQLVFGQSLPYEAFTPFTSVHSDVEILQITVGNVYKILVNGIGFSYVAQMGDTVSSVASMLAGSISNSQLEASAVGNSGHVEITNESSSTAEFLVGTDGTQPIQIVKVFDAAVQPAYGWTGGQENRLL